MAETEMQLHVMEVDGEWAIYVEVSESESTEVQDGEGMHFLDKFRTHEEANAFIKGANWGIVGTIRFFEHDGQGGGTWESLE